MIFKDTLKLKQFAQVGNVNFAAVKKTIEHTEQLHLLPILGEEFTLLDAAYTAALDDINLSEAQQKLLDKCRRVIGPYVCYYYAPIADLILSDSGAQRIENANLKTAYQYQVKNFQQANLSVAQEATEQLLAFLEENKTDYPTWAASDQYKEFKKLFIKSGSEFNRLFHTASPYSIFLKCRTKMADIEENDIANLLGNTLYADLKTKDQNGTLSTAEKNLVEKLKRAIANLTIGYSMPMLNINISSQGLSMITQTARTGDDQLSTRTNADHEAISHAQRSALATGKLWLNNARAYLKEQKDIFPDYPGNTSSQQTISQKTGGGAFGLV